MKLFEKYPQGVQVYCDGNLTYFSIYVEDENGTMQLKESVMFPKGLVRTKAVEYAQNYIEKELERYENINP